jgi:hypothetical protein
MTPEHLKPAILIQALTDVLPKNEKAATNPVAALIV